MLQRFVIQLPEWARSNHPLIRYELNQAQVQAQQPSQWVRYLRTAGIFALLMVLFWSGYAIATGFFRNPPGQSLTESAMAVLFWPTLIIQLILQTAAFALTVNTVNERKQRQTWDSLRATEGGVGLALRARWASVYYRMRPLLGLVLVIRVGFIIGILADLTAFQGRYIDLLVNRITPEVSPAAGALLLAFIMTSGFLLPLTTIGLEAVLGLFVSVSFQHRIYNGMIQIILVVIRLVVVIALLAAAHRFIRGDLAVSNGGDWLLMGGFAAFGDWGLSFLQLGFYGELWATIPYAVFLGVGLLIFALAQSALTEWILGYVIRRAEQIG